MDTWLVTAASWKSGTIINSISSGQELNVCTRVAADLPVFAAAAADDLSSMAAIMFTLKQLLTVWKHLDSMCITMWPTTFFYTPRKKYPLLFLVKQNLHKQPLNTTFFIHINYIYNDTGSQFHCELSVFTMGCYVRWSKANIATVYTVFIPIPHNPIAASALKALKT